MKSGKVAICISGQTRTGIKAHTSFVNFFSSLPNYDIFYHTWESTPEKSKKIESIYKPVLYKEESSLGRPHESSFGNMLYSMLMANELKKQYEIENDFRYDLVIKTRFDLIFPNTSVFPDNNIWPRTIYSAGGNFGINHTDYENHGISDLIFWGDSQSMDIATNVYRYYKFTALAKNIYLQNGYKIDPKDYYLSPGTLIYQRTIEKNIAHIRINGIGEVPWRDDVAHLDPVNDYHKIRERYARI